MGLGCTGELLVAAIASHLGMEALALVMMRAKQSREFGRHGWSGQWRRQSLGNLAGGVLIFSKI